MSGHSDHLLFDIYISLFDQFIVKPLFLFFFKFNYIGQGNIEVTLSTEDEYDLEKIRNQFTGESELINFDGGKIVLSIPYTDHLPDDLDNIEERKKELGVNGISVSLITLEQVFLKCVFMTSFHFKLTFRHF